MDSSTGSEGALRRSRPLRAETCGAIGITGSRASAAREGIECVSVAETNAAPTLGSAPRRRVPPSRYSPTGKPGSTIAEAGLNFRVRNGNGCGPCSMDGGKNTQSGDHRPSNIFLGPRPMRRAWLASGQASRAISTGQLRALLRFHLRPIDVLVSDGPSGDRSLGEISSWGGLPT